MIYYEQNILSTELQVYSITVFLDIVLLKGPILPFTSDQSTILYEKSDIFNKLAFQVRIYFPKNGL